MRAVPRSLLDLREAIDLGAVERREVRIERAPQRFKRFSLPLDELPLAVQLGRIYSRSCSTSGISSTY